MDQRLKKIAKLLPQVAADHRNEAMLRARERVDDARTELRRALRQLKNATADAKSMAEVVKQVNQMLTDIERTEKEAEARMKKWRKKHPQPFAEFHIGQKSYLDEPAKSKRPPVKRKAAKK